MQKGSHLIITTTISPQHTKRRIHHYPGLPRSPIERQDTPRNGTEWDGWLNGPHSRWVTGNLSECWIPILNPWPGKIMGSFLSGRKREWIWLHPWQIYRPSTLLLLLLTDRSPHRKQNHVHLRSHVHSVLHLNAKNARLLLRFIYDLCSVTTTTKIPLRLRPP